MGIYSDILANARTIDTSSPREGNDRAVVRQLQALMDRQGDREYPSGYAARNEVQSIAAHQGIVSGGTFILAFTLWDGTEFETAAIAYNANAATIQTAVNTAAAAAVDGYVAGDIAVTGGPLTTTPVVLTFSGDSVAGQNLDPVVVDDALLTGGGSAGAVSVTTEGQGDRTAWAILKECGAISGSLPNQGESPSGLTAATNRATNPHLPDAATLKALAHEAAVQDRNGDVEDAILDALGL